MELWEVNALAGLIANREQVTVPLNNFAEMMASPLPELRGAPMTDLLLDGVPLVRTREQWPETGEKKSSYSPNLPIPMIEGKIDPDNDDQLSGSRTEVEKDLSVGIIITHTYTCRLAR